MIDAFITIVFNSHFWPLAIWMMSTLMLFWLSRHAEEYIPRQTQIDLGIALSRKIRAHWNDIIVIYAVSLINYLLIFRSVKIFSLRLYLPSIYRSVSMTLMSIVFMTGVYLSWNYQDVVLIFRTGASLSFFYMIANFVADYISYAKFYSIYKKRIETNTKRFLLALLLDICFSLLIVFSIFSFTTTMFTNKINERLGDTTIREVIDNITSEYYISQEITDAVILTYFVTRSGITLPFVGIDKIKDDLFSRQINNETDRQIMIYLSAIFQNSILVYSTFVSAMMLSFIYISARLARIFNELSKLHNGLHRFLDAKHYPLRYITFISSFVWTIIYWIMFFLN